ncbi:MAG TPA: hypothetical protein VGL32_11810, partial [Acidimicrobiales bacterium]
STFTYVLVPTKSSNPAVGTLLKDFVQYAIGPGQSSATKLFYAPLPANVASASQTAAAGLS